MVGIGLTPNHCKPVSLSDIRGVAYVEFLIAFMPIFILFLGLCQLTLLTTARVLVSHAAIAAARSAIVVLEDPVDAYDGAPTGSLSEGRGTLLNVSPLLSALNVTGFTSYLTENLVPDSVASVQPAQNGARMSAIRMAAILPLMSIAPSISVIRTADDSIERGLATSATTRLLFALQYTEVATAVTVHSGESSELLASEPMNSKALLTVRVAYVFHCGIPIVRTLMCSSLSRLLDKGSSAREMAVTQRLKAQANPRVLQRWIQGDARYAILTGQATLPNQGADYVPETGGQ